MYKLTHYRQLIQDFLLQRGNQNLSYGNVETEVAFDKERDHYQIIHVEWDGNQFVYGCVIHIDIKHNKIWIQWNCTEDDIAADLVNLGIPKEDIVLGLHHPDVRKFTDYAVA